MQTIMILQYKNENMTPIKGPPPVLACYSAFCLLACLSEKRAQIRPYSDPRKSLLLLSSPPLSHQSQFCGPHTWKKGREEGYNEISFLGQNHRRPPVRPFVAYF